ncbi:bifunctional AP-4-A phosphorylase/ADP sulfurylase [Rhizophlyctis rosea]|nr:bifunctional AP-4-A phosphorylase/ADP sulfurylase [Rhizophlyctis rosea]
MSSTLATRIRTTFDRALASGHVIFHDSTQVIIPDGPVNFQVRYVPALSKKPEGGFTKAQTDADTRQKAKEKKKFNPFLPYDPHMFVEELESHNVLLNKFSIVREHVLITTKDCAAASNGLTSPRVLPYVGFYNCGGKSGASIPHKHMQFLPRAKEDADPFPPIAAVLSKLVETEEPGKPFTSHHLPFAHSFAFIPHNPTGDILAQTFRSVLSHAFSIAQIDPSLCLDPPASTTEQTSLPTTSSDSTTVAIESAEPPSYNVVFTTQWMLIVPRRKESVEGISINSVGFAGCLLAKSEGDLGILRGMGPRKVLLELGYPMGAELGGKAFAAFGKV